MLIIILSLVVAVAAAIVLGEPLLWNVLLGLALVTAGIVFGVRKAAVAATDSIAAGPLPMRPGA